MIIRTYPGILVFLCPAINCMVELPSDPPFLIPHERPCTLLRVLVLKPGRPPLPGRSTDEPGRHHSSFAISPLHCRS
ncbi:hypothetical protein K438DRAFT_1817911 [Mycena galopus ATCC 62051]|nr:hypothetical protein K438DRAFT_1817911 [Mycena galopus ATCC 62051]